MSWIDFHSKELEKEYYKKLDKTINQLYSDDITFFTPTYPPKKLIFRCFDETPFDNVKVIILGQDPYHQPNQANGLAFAVNDSKLPPSLKNIVKESGCTDTTLLKWAKQGVLLLNTILTVKESKPLSCSGIGWETYTDNAIKYLLDNTESGELLIFCLWGNFARSKKSMICGYSDVIILESSNPSPLSAHSTDKPFIGCDHFNKINDILESKGYPIIIW
jgi:uracil-DNA glycosylase